MISNKDMPAMPTQTYDHSAAMQGLGVTVTDQPGLTKREMFTMHAMQALAANSNSGYRLWKDLASDAVILADAVLAELEK